MQGLKKIEIIKHEIVLLRGKTHLSLRQKPQFIKSLICFSNSYFQMLDVLNEKTREVAQLKSENSKLRLSMQEEREKLTMDVELKVKKSNQANF